MLELLVIVATVTLAAVAIHVLYPRLTHRDADAPPRPAARRR